MTEQSADTMAAIIALEAAKIAAQRERASLTEPRSKHKLERRVRKDAQERYKELSSAQDYGISELNSMRAGVIRRAGRELRKAGLHSEPEISSFLAELDSTFPAFTEDDKHYGYIYRITNTITGSYYIGYHKHRKGEAWRAYMGSSVWLDAAMDIYGKANFEKELVAYVDTQAEALELEGRLIHEARQLGEPVYNGRGNRLPAAYIADYKQALIEEHKRYLSDTKEKTDG